MKTTDTRCTFLCLTCSVVLDTRCTLLWLTCSVVLDTTYAFLCLTCSLVLDTKSTWSGGRGCVCLVVGLQLPMRTVPITSNVASSNLVHGEVYSIEYYVIKFVRDLRQVDGFLWVLRFPPPIKLTAIIAEILLKVALTTIALPSLYICV
jgi:hypothetical protein